MSKACTPPCQPEKFAAPSNAQEAILVEFNPDVLNCFKICDVTEVADVSSITSTSRNVSVGIKITRAVA